MNTMKFGRLFLSVFCVLALSIMISYPVYSSHKHVVRPSRLTTEGTCRKEKEFVTTDIIYARGRFFPPNTDVNIYVTYNRVWRRGDLLASTDVSGGIEIVRTDSGGRIPCPTSVWLTPSRGDYDIVVDANQDGTYDPRDGDAVYKGSVRRGFKVR